MYIQDAMRRQRQDGSGQHFAVGGNNDNVRLKVRQLLHRVSVFQAGGLLNTETECQSGLLNRRRQRQPSPAGFFIRLGIYRRYFVTVEHELLKGRYGKLGGTHKYYAQRYFTLLTD
jgi:hypothetical protein